MKKLDAQQQEKISSVEQLRVLSELVARNRYSSLLGLTFGGNRDLYTTLGYKNDLQYSDYWNMFRRGRLGRRIISAPVKSTWRGEISIFENEEPEETAFEEAWKKLDAKFKVISKFSRLDKLVGLGDFAVLLLGFNDGKELKEPLAGVNLELTYIQPYAFNNIQIKTYEQDEKNSRFGLPVIYSLTTQAVGTLSGATTGQNTGKTLEVHYSRIIHVAEDLLDNDIIGTPRLESVYNGLEDLEKIAGGSAEMYWQGALGGKAFSSKDGATIPEPSQAAMQTSIDEYVHNLRRYLLLQNMDVQNLAPTVTDPGPSIQAQLDLISGDTGIPKRILIGSERGELASSQDESNWLNVIKERRIQYAEPYIIRPFVDLLLKVGALPPTQSGEYQVEWPDLWASSATEQATVAKTKSEALAAYLNAPGADQVMPIDFFLEEILHLDRKQLDRIKEMLEGQEPVLEEREFDDLGNPIVNFNPNHGKDGKFSSGKGSGSDNDHASLMDLMNVMKNFGLSKAESLEIISKVAKNKTAGSKIFHIPGLKEVMSRFGFSDTEISTILAR